jgi:hypothetical protein
MRTVLGNGLDNRSSASGDRGTSQRRRLLESGTTEDVVGAQSLDVRLIERSPPRHWS